MKPFSNIKKAFEDLIFPPTCMICQKGLVEGESFLCIECCQKLPKTNFHLFKANPLFQKFKGRIPIQKATSFLYFTKKGEVQSLIHQLKYKGNNEIGLYLGALFASDLSDENWLNKFNYILPVPIHSLKKRKRGYNQSNMIAKGISKVNKIPIAPEKVFIKIKNTTSQTRKDELNRLLNVRHSFHLNQQGFFQNKHVLIIDDVITTGATIEACVQELLQDVPASISVATLAISSDI